MPKASEQYRGYTITVQPIKDHDDLWDAEYELVPDAGETPARPVRSMTARGHIDAEAAQLSGFQVARIEVDNLLALLAG